MIPVSICFQIHLKGLLIINKINTGKSSVQAWDTGWLSSGHFCPKLGASLSRSRLWTPWMMPMWASGSLGDGPGGLEHSRGKPALPLPTPFPPVQHSLHPTPVRLPSPFLTHINSPSTRTGSEPRFVDRPRFSGALDLYLIQDLSPAGEGGLLQGPQEGVSPGVDCVYFAPGRMGTTAQQLSRQGWPSGLGCCILLPADLP